MTQDIVVPVPPAFAKTALIDARKWREMHDEAAKDPLTFWRVAGRRIDWITPYTKVRDVSYDAKDLHIRWYYDGTLNASFNCIDRHLKQRGAQTAIIWEGDDPTQSRTVTYAELHEATCRLANALKALGVTKGDRVCIYMPMIPEAADRKSTRLNSSH